MLKYQIEYYHQFLSHRTLNPCSPSVSSHAVRTPAGTTIRHLTNVEAHAVCMSLREEGRLARILSECSWCKLPVEMFSEHHLRGHHFCSSQCQFEWFEHWS